MLDQPSESRGNDAGESELKPSEATAVVARAQAGEAQAFERLFRDHHVRVYNLVYHVLRDRAEAEDVTQRAFVRAWEELPRLRDAGAFPSWLNRIAVNLARDAARSPAARTASGEDPEPVLERAADGSAAPSDDLLAQERDAEVHRAIGSLPDHQREVVVMHHLQGTPVQEVAQQLGLALGTVLSRLARGREALRRKLAPYVEQ
jgi:RNA polymerase sigma factor (sigma-70 family)